VERPRKRRGGKALRERTADIKKTQGEVKMKDERTILPPMCMVRKSAVSILGEASRGSKKHNNGGRVEKGGVHVPTKVQTGGGDTGRSCGSYF